MGSVPKRATSRFVLALLVGALLLLWSTWDVPLPRLEENFEFSDLDTGTCCAVPGTFHVRLNVVRNSGGQSERIRDTLPETIEVQAVLPRQGFQIAFGQQALARALQRLTRR